MKQHLSFYHKGFSVIEIILAVAIFVILSSGVMTVILQGLDSNRLGEEQTIANQYASLGMEAVRSIKNQNFAGLVNSAGTGIASISGVWAFSGASNTLASKYTRVLKVEDVNRDVSGNIVSGSGTLDAYTKKISSTVSWNFTPTRANSVVLTSYLTDWKRPLVAGGMLVYGNGGTTTDAMLYRTVDYLGNWSSPASIADVDGGSSNRAVRAIRVYASASRNEKIILSRHYNGTTQYIYAQVFNGTTWGNVQLLSSWNAATFLDVQNFDGSYLANGNFMAVYSDNTVIPKMATWNGTSWVTGSSLTTLGGGNIPNFVVAKARNGTNEVMAAFFTQASDTITQYYDGSAWSAITSHATQAPVTTKQSVDFDWSPNNVLIGGLVYADGNNDRQLHIKIWTANGTGGGSWSAVANTGNQGIGSTRVGARRIVGRPGANEFIACNSNTQDDIICYTANFTPTWSNPTNQTIETTTDTGIQRPFDLGFEQVAGSTALNVYSNNTTTPQLKKYTAGSTTWDASATTLPILTGSVETVRLAPRTTTDDILILYADTNNDLSSIMWNGTSNTASPSATPHGTNGSADEDYWYDFVWDAY